jgi:hypothetical protein
MLVILALAALIFAFPAFTALLTDWWWFREIGYEVVFIRELLTRSLLFLIVGAVTSVALYLNLRIVNVGPSVPELDLTRALRRVSLPFSLVLGLLAGLGAAPAWDLVLQMINRTPFGTLDPVFSRDIGFYVFTLPGLSAAIGFLSSLTVGCLILLLLV